jgi:hypothetical protein
MSVRPALNDVRILGQLPSVGWRAVFRGENAPDVPDVAAWVLVLPRFPDDCDETTVFGLVGDGLDPKPTYDAGSGPLR